MEPFKMWCWRKMEDKMTRESNWFTHNLRRNCILRDAFEGQMMKLKGVRRRRTKFLDDLRNRKRYWELKEEAGDRKSWK